jgi:hypothetical protein
VSGECVVPAAISFYAWTNCGHKRGPNGVHGAWSFQYLECAARASSMAAWAS